MNQENETIVTGEMMNRLRDAGVSAGYEPVPQNLQEAASKILGNKQIGYMTQKFKRSLKKQKTSTGNRRREIAILAARASLESEGLLCR